MSNIDRKQATTAFEEYVSAYDPANPRIALKIDHTMRVAGLCERIAREEGLPPDDIELAWLLGLLHDIGRFEQVRRYDTFNDAQSVNHATFGAQVLFEGERNMGKEGECDIGKSANSFEAPSRETPSGTSHAMPANACMPKALPRVADAQDAAPFGLTAQEGNALSEHPQYSMASSHAHAALIREFIANPCHDGLIRTAVEMHNVYRLPDGLDARTRTLCNVLRDADKIDILKVNCTLPIQDIYGIPESAMTGSALSPACIEHFYQKECLPRGVRQHPADVFLGHLCFAWELVFDASLRIAREQGHLRSMLDRTWEDPSTQRAFAEMAAFMTTELHL